MIRRATLNDNPQLYPLLYEIFESMALPLIDWLSPYDMRALFLEVMAEPDSRFSYENALVCERDGQIVGMLYGYDCQREPYLDDCLFARYERYGLGDRPQHFSGRETYDNEWYIDSLVIHPQYRGQGIAQQLLSHLDLIAPIDCTIGLNCDVDNPRARQLYERLGFSVVGPQRILEHHYDHMQVPCRQLVDRNKNSVVHSP